MRRLPTRYFTSHAEVWDSIRSLHVAESEVEEAICRALGDQPLGRLVDVGTGTGRMIELFGRKAADHSIGIDRSSEMLRLARVKLEAAGIPSSLRQGDMYALPLDDGSADTVIIHQVLHYAHSPAAAIDEAARVLAPDGRLLIVDFAAHEREELRATDAHIRLGFDDETMTGWFKAAGIAVDHVEHLEGGELTVTVWRGAKAGPAPNGGPHEPRSNRLMNPRTIVRGGSRRYRTSASNSSRRRRRRWPRPFGSRSRPSSRFIRASSPSPTARAARPASGPTRPSSASSRKPR